MDSIEEIKDRLDVSEVVGAYVQLKPSGSNLKGLCPFHNEHTPSFMVNNEKRIWHCFGCSEGGDIFTFVQKVEGLDFAQSLENLARKAGVSLEEKAGDRTSTKLKEKLYDINELAAKYYQQAFTKSSKAQEYVIKKRGFNKQAVVDFRIGYAPSNSDGLYRFLSRHGYGDSEIVKAGLMRRYRDSNMDLFRNRVMFPFLDSMGRVVGFTGRILDDNIQPKYLNSPQSLIFDKSRYVFGLLQAKEAIRKSDEAVIVEGNLDVITSHQHGLRQVVAVSGTAVTPYQIKAISRLAKNIKLAFDQDSAGLQATQRAIGIAQNLGVNLYVIDFAGAKDPDELIRKKREGAKIWKDNVSNATYVMDWIFTMVSSQFDKNTAIGKKSIVTKLLNTITKLSDEVERDHYLKKLAEIVDVSEDLLRNKLDKNNDDFQGQALKIPNKNYTPEIHEESKVVADAFLSLNLLFSDVRPSLADLSESHFSTIANKQIYNVLKTMGDKIIDDKLPVDLHEYDATVKILLINGEMNYQTWAPLDRRIEAYTLAQRLQHLYIKKLNEKLVQQIKVAEQANDKALQKELLQQFRDLVAKQL
jgi:DNA primase